MKVVSNGIHTFSMNTTMITLLRALQSKRAEIGCFDPAIFEYDVLTMFSLSRMDHNDVSKAKEHLKRFIFAKHDETAVSHQ